MFFKILGQIAYKIFDKLTNIPLFIIFYIYVLISILVYVPIRTVVMFLYNTTKRKWSNYKAYMAGPNIFPPIDYELWESNAMKVAWEKYYEDMRVVEIMQMMAEIRRREIREERRRNPDMFFYLNYYFNEYVSADDLGSILNKRKRENLVDYNQDKEEFFEEAPLNINGDGSPINVNLKRIKYANFDDFQLGEIIPDNVIFPPKYNYLYEKSLKARGNFCISQKQQILRPFEVLPNREQKRVKYKLYQYWGNPYYLESDESFKEFKQRNQKKLRALLFADISLFLINEILYLLFSTVIGIFWFPIVFLTGAYIFFVDIFYHIPVKFLTDEYNFFIMYPRWVEKKQQIFEEYGEAIFGIVFDMFMRVIFFFYAITIYAAVFPFIILYNLLCILAHFIFFRFLYCKVFIPTYIFIAPKFYRYFLRPVVNGFVRTYLFIFRLIIPKKIRRKVNAKLIIYGLRDNLLFKERLEKHRNFWIQVIFGVTQGFMILSLYIIIIAFTWDHGFGSIVDYSIYIQGYYSPFFAAAYLWLLFFCFLCLRWMWLFHAEFPVHFDSLFVFLYVIFYYYHLGDGTIYTMTFPSNPWMPYGEVYKIHWKWIQTGSWVDQWIYYFLSYIMWLKNLHPSITYVFVEIEEWYKFWVKVIEFIWRDIKELIIPNLPIYNVENLKVPDGIGEFVNFEWFTDTFQIDRKRKFRWTVWEFGRVNVIAYLKELEEEAQLREFLAAREEERKSKFFFFFDKHYRDVLLAKLAARK